MNNLTIKQLRYVDALARHGHFGHAAAACNVTQPALSMQIKEMEEAFGLPLFERTPRQVRLTGFGETVLTRAKDILRAVDELDDLARAARGGLTGRLRLGVIPTIAPYLLPRLIGTLGLHYPQIDLHIRETLTPRLLEDLSAGRLDTAILALPVSVPALTEVPLHDEEFVLVRPAEDDDKPVPDGEALAQMRLLLLEEGHCFRDQALSFCNIRSSLPREGLDGSSLSTLVQMVGAGIGVTLIPDMAVGVETRSATVSVARFAQATPKRTIGMVWRKASPLATELEGMAEVVRTAIMPEGLCVGPTPG
ncbi:hydrogen peroxide-inducible genes activator [Jannaschia sp. CCS1]|uniref:hydrogen peroxide-inducible genes activator n=1 Tax=Jannaschia sp. (strain CCS1) TaxID=290400 RepID=UPI000053DCFB|nr:hydrogen peroxide-inducible genes activator [Jannaschia sp. CCS1]ABD54502.1 transcriptional regulator, LysR family [Jannaschia sp. CCS1]